MSGTRPQSIRWFERLIYLGLGLSAVDAYLTWDEVMSDPAPGAPGQAFMALMLCLTIAIELLFVWLIAYRASSIARWIFVGLSLVGLLFLPIAGLAELRAYGDLSAAMVLSGQLFSVIEIWLLFRRDSRDWLAGQWPVDPEIFS